MRSGRYRIAGWMLIATALGAPGLRADTLELADGRKLQNCYIRDEGTRILVWHRLADVGGPPEVFPRSQIKGFKIERDEAWDEKPDLPDLTVTFIQITPTLPGLHGRVHYDKYGRPKIAGAPVLKDLGEKSYLEPSKVVSDVKFQYRPGDTVTLTAHVKNVGFAAAQPFRYQWLIDDKTVKEGAHRKPLAEMEETTFSIKWRWQRGFHHVTFRIIYDQTEIARINNEVRDPLWGWGFVYIVNPGRVAAWHEFRSAYGTFCWEDFYRWHIDIMNQLFEAAVFPSSPEGIKARVRLDRIVYTEDVAAAEQGRVRADNLLYDQGAWIWRDSPEELESGKWIQTDKVWRNQTEWSLPHELGHQLGRTDWYVLDYEGHENHVMPDNGEKVSHFMRHAVQMMHWHGPQVYGEGDAGYLNMTLGKPRGHFGDHYFAIPRQVYLRIVDINGRGLPDATVEVFQRGTLVEPEGKPRKDHGVTYWPVVEDGNFGHPISKNPVIAGTTDEWGLLRLPNRPVEEVRTLNGFHRRSNPFGNINVVGQRGLLLIRVTKDGRPAHFWLEIHQCITAWFRGHKNYWEIEIETPFGSIDSPPPPRDIAVEKTGEHSVRVTWSPPMVVHERQYFNHVIGYRVYRRIGNDGLNDRPWFPVATLGPNATTATIDRREFPDDLYWYSKADRYGVTAIGDCSLESELVETLLREE